MPGANTLTIEVTNVSQNGLWLIICDEELFLPFTEFPWFKSATISNILHVELVGTDHLYWPELDIDLSVESIRHPQRFPLISKSQV